VGGLRMVELDATGLGELVCGSIELGEEVRIIGYVKQWSQGLGFGFRE